MNRGMSEIVKTISKIVAPFIIIFGISIVFYGHLTPGGGFPGGVVISASFVLLLLSYGKEKVLSKLSLEKSDILHNIGAILFLSIALIGFLEGIFFLNIFNKGKLFSLWSGGNLLFSNIAIGIKIGTSLFLGITLLSMVRIVCKDNKIEYFEKKEDIE
ncbi:MAG: cation:proton antiporter [Candidatus Omnitrophica bacterium]|nr:cation:proton antiporter [Candidatus Omnitrophota bacterium]MCM8807127.1 cation:proton antiporter [Candidatus Omnitrophota bacterium]